MHLRLFLFKDKTLLLLENANMQLFIMEDKKSMSFKIFLFFQKSFVVGEKIARYQVSSYTEYLVSSYTIFGIQLSDCPVIRAFGNISTGTRWHRTGASPLKLKLTIMFFYQLSSF